MILEPTRYRVDVPVAGERLEIEKASKRSSRGPMADDHQQQLEEPLVGGSMGGIGLVLRRKARTEAGSGEALRSSASGGLEFPAEDDLRLGSSFLRPSTASAASSSRPRGAPFPCMHAVTDDPTASQP